MFTSLLEIFYNQVYLAFPNIKKTNLSGDYENLSTRYRSGPTKGYKNVREVFAYIEGRMPATFGVIRHVLDYLPSSSSPRSILDIGSGPGTGILAALEKYHDIHQIIGFENDAHMAHLNGTVLKKLFSDKEFHINTQDVLKLKNFPKSDLTLLSYFLAEVPEVYQEELLKNIWEATEQFLVIITPGTPLHFKQLIKWRDLLINQNGHIIAPCPGNGRCPLINSSKDWCHFSTRIDRRVSHKSVKKASKGFEDEKFSYLIVGRKPYENDTLPIIKKPIKKSGHIILDLCIDEDSDFNKVERKIISKSSKGLYKDFSKLEWGDLAKKEKIHS